MKNVFDIDDKLLAKNPVAIKFAKLSEEISEFMPVSSITTEVIDYYCRVYLYEKKHEWNWMDKVDCYLGLPDYVKKETDLQKIKYKIFPLSLVYKIAAQSMNDFKFSLYNEKSLTEDDFFFHFDYMTFSDHMKEFENGLENNLEQWADKVTLKWKAMIKKIKDKPYKYSDLRISTQLNHYWHTIFRYRLKQNIIAVTIKEWFDYSIGQDYGMWEHYKKRGEFDDMVEAIQFYDIPTIYKINEDKLFSGSYEFNALFPTAHDFGKAIIRFYWLNKRLLEDNPTNYIIEQELDFTKQLILNSNKRFLKKIGYVNKDE